MSLKHDKFYARAWEKEEEKPIFDAENNNATPPISSENPEQSDLSNKEMRNTPGTAQKCSPELFPRKEEFFDVTDTHPYMEPDVETSLQQPNKSPTNPRSYRYSFRHIPKPNCIENYRY